MRISIRTAQPADLPALRYVFRRSSLSNRGDRDRLLGQPDALLLGDAAVEGGHTRVAEVAGRIAGFATGIPGSGSIELDDLFVDPDLMRRGVGRALIEDLIAIAARGGFSRIEVTANHDALPFYRAVGFLQAEPAATRFGPAPRMYLEVPVMAVPETAPAPGA